MQRFEALTKPLPCIFAETEHAALRRQTTQCTAHPADREKWGSAARAGSFKSPSVSSGRWDGLI